MQAEHTYLKVTYNGTNITSDIGKSLIAFTYTDNMEDADTLDITLEDAAGKWQMDWYPEKGAKIIAEMGVKNGDILPCGTFEIDEIEQSGPPDVINIRCIAAGFKTGKKRSKKNHVNEGKTLSEIVRTIAASCGLTVEGKISDVRVGRKVQRKEMDMRLLRRLAREYGYTFNIRDKKATFTPTKELEGRKPVLTLKKGDLTNYSIRDKSTKTYALASIKYHNPDTGETISHEEKEGGVEGSDDELVLQLTAETKAQAIMMTQAALHAANKLQQSGTITVPGSPIICAGNVIELTEIGLLSGKYIIRSSAHVIGLSEGWLADCEVYKVGFVDESKRKPK